MPLKITLGAWRAVCTWIENYSPFRYDKRLLAIPTSYNYFQIIIRIEVDFKD